MMATILGFDRLAASRYVFINLFIFPFMIPSLWPMYLSIAIFNGYSYVISRKLHGFMAGLSTSTNLMIFFCI